MTEEVPRIKAMGTFLSGRFTSPAANVTLFHPSYAQRAATIATPKDETNPAPEGAASEALPSACPRPSA